MSTAFKQQIVISGVGGQGVLFVTRLLAEAAIARGLPVLTSETHGMAQRGGSVVSHLKVGDFSSPLIRSGGTIDRKYNFSAFTEDVEDFHQPHVELHHDWQIAPDWKLNQKLFWIQGKGYFDFGGTFRSAQYLRLLPHLRRARDNR